MCGVWQVCVKCVVFGRCVLSISVWCLAGVCKVCCVWQVWVRWFGDHTFTQVEPVKLKTLTEGLDAQHRETKKHRK